MVSYVWAQVFQTISDGSLVAFQKSFNISMKILNSIAQG